MISFINVQNMLIKTFHFGKIMQKWLNSSHIHFYWIIVKKKQACVYVLVRILVLSMHFLPEKTIYDNFPYCFISVSNTLICYGILPKNCCKIYFFTYLFYSFVHTGRIWCHSGAIFIISLKSVKKWHFSYRFSNRK